MNDRDLRLALLHGLFVILVGMLVAGAPLTGLVMRDIYGQSVAGIPGDYRAWLMAHLEGLLNGLLLLAMALGSRFAALSGRQSRFLLWALADSAWGNLAGAILAPVFGVRGMAYDFDLANNVVTGVFSVAFVGTIASFYLLIAGLLRSGRA